MPNIVHRTEPDRRRHPCRRDSTDNFEPRTASGDDVPPDEREGPTSRPRRRCPAFHKQKPVIDAETDIAADVAPEPLPTCPPPCGRTIVHREQSPLLPQSGYWTKVS